MDGENIPDVILTKGSDRMQVEVYVTHRCGSEKRAEIAGPGYRRSRLTCPGCPETRQSLVSTRQF
jgi:hypothetical protein